jgi:hypothetical protein
MILIQGEDGKKRYKWTIHTKYRIIEEANNGTRSTLPETRNKITFPQYMEIFL